jgi:hypothetical protein
VVPRVHLARLLTIAASLILACVVLAGQVATFSHAFTTQHSVCAEHGELIHGDGATALGAPAAGALDVLAALPETEHDHGCGLLTGLSQSCAPLPEPAGLAAPESPDASEPASSALCSPLLQDRLAFAPKTSPPGSPTTS